MNMIQSAIFNSTFAPTIKESYTQVDLKQQLFDEFKKIQPDVQKYVKIIVDDAKAKNISLTATSAPEEEAKGNPYYENLNCKDIQDKIKTKYVLYIKILKWGYSGGYGSFINFYASIHECETGKMIWGEYSDSKENAILFSNTGFTKEKAIERLKPTLEKVSSLVIKKIHEKG